MEEEVRQGRPLCRRVCVRVPVGRYLSFEGERSPLGRTSIVLNVIISFVAKMVKLTKEPVQYQIVGKL